MFGCKTPGCTNEREHGEGFCATHLVNTRPLEPVKTEPRERKPRRYDGPRVREPWETWLDMSLAERKIFAQHLTPEVLAEFEAQIEAEWQEQKATQSGPGRR